MRSRLTRATYEVHSWRICVKSVLPTFRTATYSAFKRLRFLKLVRCLVLSEEFRVGVAVQTGTSYKAKVDDPLLEEVLTALATVLGVTPELISKAEGIAEFSLDALLPQLPAVTAYEPQAQLPKITYRPFSLYPAVSRDIAMWVPEAVTTQSVEEILAAEAGPLCVRLTHVDTFSKDGKTSLAFRLVFQSFDKTLTDEEVQGYMDTLYKTVANQGWEAR